jgi:hypothetical protein
MRPANDTSKTFVFLHDFAIPNCVTGLLIQTGMFRILCRFLDCGCVPQEQPERQGGFETLMKSGALRLVCDTAALVG